MNTRNYGLYAIAGAIAFVGALWLGVPAATVLFAVVILACPLMMIFMMRGMHGDGHDMGRMPPRDEDHPSHHDDLAQHS